jgi:hypothetical protein
MLHSRKKIARTVVSPTNDSADFAGAEDSKGETFEAIQFPKIDGKASGWKEKTNDTLAKQTIELIEQMSSEGILNTRIASLVNDEIKTPGAHFIARQFKTLISQVAIIYEMDSFEQVIAPYIQQKYLELGSPSLIPGSVGSYIFGCYLSSYGNDKLNRFCTPICAASIRIPNPSGTQLLRCRQKVIWTDGGETPVFILIEDTIENTHSAKVFLPWPSQDTRFLGLTQGALQEIKDFDVDIIQVYGQLPDNTYLTLLEITPIGRVPVVARIYISPIEEVISRNAENVSKDNIVKLQTPLKTGEPGSTALFLLVGVGVLLAVVVGMSYGGKSKKK